MLGFVALVPWLRTLDAERTVRGTLLSAWAMSVAYTAGALWWFGVAIGSYTQAGSAAGIALLLLAAPLLQPQVLAYALVRHAVGRGRGALVRSIAAAAAWVAAEWLVPRLLGDTFGYGLYPSQLLRQAADVGGVTGLTFLLVLVNEAIAVALARRHQGVRAVSRPLALAALAPLLLASYGFAALRAEPAAAASLRMGLVQSNIVDYERLRRERGAGAVVREVLDTHYAMSYDAVERRGAQAMLWSETVYPTTFGRPKSEAGAELDREILQIVNAAGVPFVFGTYERDAAGEYNAAAFVAPGRGLLGFYRKTRPFPLTEYVPPWLDGPLLRQWLPWAGAWRPGSGARVLPLRLRDGREVPVLPLICLDDVDADLVVAGARLGALVILTMSNDSWFTAAPQGARLHLQAAAFRSIETRLPQFRVTSNGYSAVIDATGTVIAATRMGERTLVIGDVPLREPPRTLVLAWGDWVGRTAAAFLLLFAFFEGWLRWWKRRAPTADAPAAATFPARVVVLPRAARVAAAVLRTFARLALLWMAAAIVLGEAGLQAGTLVQIRTFVAFFLAPELAAWCVLRAFAAHASIEQEQLLLVRGRQRLQLALGHIAALEPWRLPLPGAGTSLRLASGARWNHELLVDDPGLLAALAQAAGVPSKEPPRLAGYLAARHARRRGVLDHPAMKFVLLPLALALPAFRLHQHIAYGSTFGEYHAFGLGAYLQGFALWWASWAIGVVLCAAVLRTLVEGGALLAAWVRPASAVSVRRGLERAGLAALYLGLPAWLLLRIVAP